MKEKTDFENKGGTRHCRTRFWVSLLLICAMCIALVPMAASAAPPIEPNDPRILYNGVVTIVNDSAAFNVPVSPMSGGYSATGPTTQCVNGSVASMLRAAGFQYDIWASTNKGTDAQGNVVRTYTLMNMTIPDGTVYLNGLANPSGDNEAWRSFDDFGTGSASLKYDANELVPNGTTIYTIWGDNNKIGSNGDKDAVKAVVILTMNLVEPGDPSDPSDPEEPTVIETSVSLKTTNVDITDQTIETPSGVEKIEVPGNTPYGVLTSLYSDKTLNDLAFWGKKYSEENNWYLSIQTLNGYEHKGEINTVEYSWEGYVNNVPLNGSVAAFPTGNAGYDKLLQKNDLVTFAYVPKGGSISEAVQIVNVTVDGVQFVPSPAVTESLLDSPTVDVVTGAVRFPPAVAGQAPIKTSKNSFYTILTKAGYNYTTSGTTLSTLTINDVTYPVITDTTGDFGWKIVDAIDGTGIVSPSLNDVVPVEKSGSTYYLWYGSDEGARDASGVLHLTSQNAVYYVAMTVNVAEPEPIAISTQEQLDLIGKDLYYPAEYPLDGDYYLANDITLTGPVRIGWGGSQGDSNAFSGTFDGRGYVINDLSLEGNGYLGLFYKLDEASVSNLTLNNVRLNSTSTYAGALVGSEASASVIENCHVNGNFVVTGTSSFLVSRLTGASKVIGCSVSGNLSASGQSIGGFAGTIPKASSVEIKDCYANINLSVTQSSSEKGYTGGIVGSAVGASNVISNCYVTGSISNINRGHVGGIIGSTYASSSNAKAISVTVTDCVSLLNNVSGADKFNTTVAPVVGYVTPGLNSMVIENCSAWDGMTCNGKLFSSITPATTAAYGTFVSNTTFWNTYETADPGVWGSFSSDVWRANSGNENYQLPVLATQTTPVSGDALYLTIEPTPAPEPCVVLADRVINITTANASVSFGEILTAAGYTYESVKGVEATGYSDREYLEVLTINGTSYPAVMNTTDAFEWKFTNGFGTNAALYKKGLNDDVTKSQSGSTFYLFFIDTSISRPDGKTYDFQTEYSKYLVNLTVNLADPETPPSDPVATTVVLSGLPTGSIDLASGSITGTLTAVVNDETGAAMPGTKIVSWTSSNETVLTIDANGTYTAKAVGTANITATSVSNSSAYSSAVITVVDSTPAPVDAKEVTVSLTTGIIDLYNATVSQADANATSILIPENTPFGALYSLSQANNTVQSVHFWGGKYTSFTNWQYLSLEDLNGYLHKNTIDGVKYYWDGFVNGEKLNGDLKPAEGSVTGYGTALKAGDVVTFAYVPASGDLSTAKELINITVGSVETIPCKILDDTTVTIVTENSRVSFGEILTAAGYSYVGVNGALVGSYSDREYLEQLTLNNISYPAKVNLVDRFEWKFTNGFGTSATLYKEGLNAYVDKSQSGQTFYLFFIDNSVSRPDGKTYDFQMEYSKYLVNLTVNLNDPVPTSLTITAPAAGSSYNISDNFTAAAIVYDQTGAEMPDAVVVWNSSNNKVFSVDGTKFTATGAGNVEIIAECGNATAKIPVVVLPDPVKPKIPEVVTTGSDGTTVIDKSNSNVTVKTEEKKVEIKDPVSNVSLEVSYDDDMETTGNNVSGTVANVVAKYPPMPIVSDPTTTELGSGLTLDVKIDLGTNVETKLPTFKAEINPDVKQQIENLKIDGKQYTVGLMLQSEGVAEGFNEKVGKVTLTFDKISNEWLAKFGGNLAIVHTADDGTVQVLTSYTTVPNEDGKTSKLTVESDLGFSAYALAGYTVTSDPVTPAADNGGADDGAALLASVGAGAKPTVTAQPTTAPTVVVPTSTVTVQPTGSQQTAVPTTAATTAAATTAATQAPAPVFGLLLGLLGAAVLLRRT